MARERSIASAIAEYLSSIANCETASNNTWMTRHEIALDNILKTLPSGSGIDCGTVLDRNQSTLRKLVFNVSFHHMNDVGMYDGWTQHRVVVTPSFIGGFDIRITGRNRNDIKDYLAEIYHTALSQIVDLDSFYEESNNAA